MDILRFFQSVLITVWRYFEQGADLLSFITPKAALRKVLYYCLIFVLIFGSVFGKTTYQQVSAFIGGRIGSAASGGGSNGSSLGNVGHAMRQPAMAAGANLSAYYRLDGDGKDSLVNTGNDLTNSSAGMAEVTPRQGITCNTGQYVSTADNANVSTGATNFTFAAWVYATDTTNFVNSGSPVFINKQDNGSNNEYSLMYLSNDFGGDRANRFNWQVKSTNSTYYYVVGNNFGAGAINTWYFLVGYYDGTNIGLSVNAGTADTTSFSGNPVDAAANFQICTQNGGNYFKGTIDSVGFWKRALSSSEITTLYNSGKGMTYADMQGAGLATSIVSYWELEENGDTSRADSALATGNILGATGTPGRSNGVTQHTTNNAATFTGGTPYLSIGDNASLSVATGSFAVSTWVYLTAIAADYAIAGKGNLGDNDTEYLVYYDYNATAANSRFKFRMGSGSGSATVSADTLGVPAINEWYHIVAWYDATVTTSYISINGSTADSQSSVTARGDYTNNFRIGLDSGGSNGLEGYVDETGLWSRILSSTERSLLYASGKGLTYNQLNNGLQSSLVSWWTLDEAASFNRLDSIRHATSPATVTGATVTGGKFGQAYSFSGSSQYITLAADIEATDISVSAWIKPTTVASVCNTVVAKGDGASAATTDFIFTQGFNGSDCGTGSLAFLVGGTWHTKTYSTGFSTGLWYHVVGTFKDSTDTVELFVNGVSLGTDTNETDVMYNSADAARIGKQGTNSTNYFYGTIDDVRIYNAALTSTEVVTLYAGSEPYPCDNSCLGWWKLDEDSGTFADSAGTNEALSQYGSPAVTHNTEGIYKGGLRFASSTDTSGKYFLYNNDYNSLDSAGATTLSAWFRNSETIATGTGLAGKLSTANSSCQSYLHWQAVGSGGLSYSICDDGGVSTETVTTGSMYNDGLWHHAVGTWDGTTGSNNLRIYVDGKVVGQSSQSTVNVIKTDDIADFAIGSNRLNMFTTNYFVSGFIDDVRLMNRAMTASEIYEQYLAGRS